MSGRLVILPKKTYCPWKPENVERVLRDERLERERLEREAKQNQSQSTSTLVRTGTNNNDDGHINLFPEAKDAELNLIRSTTNKTVSSAVDYIPDAPLGGDEAMRRKSGMVPFYMRSSRSNDNNNSLHSSTTGGGRYDNNGSSFRLGDVRKKYNADVITEQITRDQYARREDDRKERIDPMNQFFKSSSPIKPGGDAIIGEKVDGEDTQRKRTTLREEEKKASQERVENESRDERHRHQTKSKRRRSREISSEDNKRRRHCHKSSSHRDNNNAVHENTNGDEIKTQQSNHKNSELEELRRRRHAREAREMERERHVINPPQHNNTTHGANVYKYSRGGKYQDQFNPALSRN